MQILKLHCYECQNYKIVFNSKHDKFTGSLVSVGKHYFYQKALRILKENKNKNEWSKKLNIRYYLKYGKS